MPMNYELGYPDDWKAIAREIKVKANWICQHCGIKCWEPHQVAAAHSKNVRTWAQFTLTVHHKDHYPPNCEPDNLIALCAPCHRKQHANDEKYGVPNPNQLSIF